MNVAPDWGHRLRLHIHKQLLLCGTLGVVWISSAIFVCTGSIVNLVPPPDRAVSSLRPVVIIYRQQGVAVHISLMTFQEFLTALALRRCYSRLCTPSLPVFLR